MLPRAGPFRLTPDPGRSFQYRGFRVAADAIKRETLTGCPVILVAGAAGVGKTTLLQGIARSYESTATKVIYLPGAQVGSGDLTWLLATAAGLTTTDLEQISLDDLRRLLSEHLEHSGGPQASLLVIADDVERLDPDAWEALLTLPTELSLTIPVTLIAACTPSFADQARRHALQDDALDSFQVTLERLTEDETQQYFHSRLEHLDADSRPRLDPSAWGELHQATEGLPRLINHVGGRLLHHWRADSGLVIDREKLQLVIADLRAEGILSPRTRDSNGEPGAASRTASSTMWAIARSFRSPSSRGVFALSAALVGLAALAMVAFGLLSLLENTAENVTVQSRPPLPTAPSATLIDSSEPRLSTPTEPEGSPVAPRPASGEPKLVSGTEPAAAKTQSDAAGAAPPTDLSDTTSASVPAGHAQLPAASPEVRRSDARPLHEEMASGPEAPEAELTQMRGHERLQTTEDSEALKAFEDASDVAGLNEPEPEKAVSEAVQRGPGTTAATDPHQAEILALLKDMETRLQNDQLTTPAGNSAWDRARSVLALDPSNTQAQAATVRIVQRYLVLAKDALSRGDHDLTKTLLDRAALVEKDSPGIARVRERLEAAVSTSAPVARIEVAILPSQTSINCPWPVEEYLTNVAKRIVEGEPRLKLANSARPGDGLDQVVATSSTWWTPEGELRTSAPTAAAEKLSAGAKVLVSSWIDCPRDEAVYEPWRRFKIALYDIEQGQFYANAGTLQDMEGPARALVDAFLDAQPDANATTVGS